MDTQTNCKKRIAILACEMANGEDKDKPFKKYGELMELILKNGKL